MQHKIIVTDDNSKTLLNPELNETYHSTKGALTEALHVFIKEGLHFADKKEVRIFEMGFGTGLNAILTFREAINSNLSINYHCIEAYPLTTSSLELVNYIQDLNLQEFENSYKQMHMSDSGSSIALSNNFEFTKYISKIQEQDLHQNYFDVIYYDAFGPKVQPELWKKEVLSLIKDIMKPGGLLVTYCAQGAFKRALKELDFTVQSIPGPPGKREMTRAIKNF